MTNFLAVKALAGFNYVRPDQVIAIAASEPTKCTIFLSGGVSIPCSEPAKDVLAKLQPASEERTSPTPEEPK
jgi:hypothetical protein